MGRPKPKAKAPTKKEKELASKIDLASKTEAIKGGGLKRAAVLESAAVTGVLTSRKDAVDVKVENFSISNWGRDLIRDTKLELNFGRRYGLIGGNGSGKSTLLAAIAARDVPIPDIIDMWYLDAEAKPEEKSAVDAVVSVVADEQKRLEELTLKLLEEDPEGNEMWLDQIAEKLDKMEPETFEARACELLNGLGFSEAMMHRATKDMSGGWRMRVALAQALFVQPMLLLLDEPTNHLDLGACVWLEQYLAQYPYTLLLTSHSEDFMNGVCTNILQLTQNNTLVTWGGNYAQYVATREETEKNQLTKYKKEQEDIQHLQEFIRSCGTYSNLVKQAGAKQKIIDKMKEAGLAEKPMADPQYHFQFPNSESLAPPVLAFHSVAFSYSGNEEDYLYEKLELGVDLDSRIALVGPNGAGKSTLLKLMREEIFPSEGQIKRNGKLRIGQYNQHSEEILDLEKSPLQFVVEKYPEGVVTTEGLRKLETDEWRAKLGSFGVTGDMQTKPMKTMSDGLRTRVVLLLISLVNPHMLLLDEPTNHLDMQCIDALARAINQFEGGVVLVSHDFRLIGQVAKEIWVCDKKTIEPWKGDIQSYKTHLKKEVLRAAKKAREDAKTKPKQKTTGGYSMSNAAGA